MANFRINRNNIYAEAPTMWSSIHETQCRRGLDDRNRNNILGVGASTFSSYSTAPINDQRDVYGTDASIYQSANSRISRSKHSTSNGASYGASPTLIIAGDRPRRHQEDVVGATATLFQSNQARTTTIAQNSNYSRIRSSRRTASNIATTAGTPIKPESYRSVTPKTKSSKATISPSYQNHHHREISPNYHNDDAIAPMTVGEATIDLIKNAGSTILTLGGELLQRK